MKRLFIATMLLILSSQAGATSEVIKQNCVDVLVFALNVNSLEAAVACSYGQSEAALACTVERAQFMGEEHVATAGFLCAQTTSTAVLNCASGLVMGGFQDAVDALSTCKAKIPSFAVGVPQSVLMNK